MGNCMKKMYQSNEFLWNVSVMAQATCDVTRRLWTCKWHTLYSTPHNPDGIELDFPLNLTGPVLVDVHRLYYSLHFVHFSVVKSVFGVHFSCDAFELWELRDKYTWHKTNYGNGETINSTIETNVDGVTQAYPALANGAVAHLTQTHIIIIIIINETKSPYVQFYFLFRHVNATWSEYPIVTANVFCVNTAQGHKALTLVFNSVTMTRPAAEDNRVPEG